MKMISDPTTAVSHNQLKSTALFLSEYAATLLACGATTLRIEKNVERIAGSYQTHVSVTVFPLHVMLTVWDTSHTHSYSNCEKIKAHALNFETNTQLSKLSWMIHDQRLTLEEAESIYHQMLSMPRLNPWLVLLLVAFANASFCRLFNGDYAAMAVVFVATLNGYYIKVKLQNDWHWDFRIATILSGLTAAIIACSGFVFSLGKTPDIALATSVLFLVPGIPFINSVSDLIHGHYICCMSRFIQAVILTFCLSLGLCLALLIMHITI